MPFYASRAAIAELGRWVRQGAVFTGPSWADGCLEPTVRYESGAWKLWYRSGGLHGEGSGPYRIGYATSIDGAHWVDSGAAILGNGTGGEAHRVICPHMRYFGSTYYLYYVDVDSAQVSVAASATGYDGFTITGSIGLSLPTGVIQFGNCHVIKVGSTYYALVEAYFDTDGYWRTYIASSSSPTSGFSYLNSGNPLSTLQVASPHGGYGGVYVNPDTPTFGGLYITCDTSSAVSPDLGNSNLYRASSSDLITWTKYGEVLGYSGVDYEVDQIADACLIEVAGKSYMYYDADEFDDGTAAIKLATIDAPLSNVVAGT